MGCAKSVPQCLGGKPDAFGGILPTRGLLANAGYGSTLFAMGLALAASTPCPMKILHLEDDARDAELVHQVFLSEWPDCQIKVVDNRADFLAQLPAGHDVILSDFNLVNFNGL